MELIYDLSHSKAAATLMKYAIAEIKKEGADCILSWCLEQSPNYRLYRKVWFLKLPEKLRPIELHFGARCFIEELKPLVYDRKNWYLSYSDSDTV